MNFLSALDGRSAGPIAVALHDAAQSGTNYPRAEIAEAVDIILTDNCHYRVSSCFRSLMTGTALGPEGENYRLVLQSSLARFKDYFENLKTSDLANCNKCFQSEDYLSCLRLAANKVEDCLRHANYDELSYLVLCLDEISQEIISPSDCPLLLA